jgi:aminoglycoside phosphotransferase (APT) family kinase protein
VAFDIPEPDERAIQSAISRDFPHLAAATIEALGHGWAFWAYRAGDTVFRFPRDPEFTQTLAVEAAVMRELAPTLPLPVAAIDVHEGGPNGLPFTSHHLVSGVPIGDLGRPLAQGAGTALGRFIRAMHAFPVERAVELGLPPLEAGGRRDAQRRFFEGQVQARILPLLAGDAAAAVTAIFESVLGDAANFAGEPVLTHADIDERNVLADPVTGQLTGVIDWGDIRIGDAAGDFTSVLYGALGDAGLRTQLPSLLEAYGMTAEELESVRPRCRFYEFCWPFHDILYGLDSHNDAVVQRGVQSLGEAVRPYGG